MSFLERERERGERDRVCKWSKKRIMERRGKGKKRRKEKSHSDGGVWIFDWGWSLCSMASATRHVAMRTRVQDWTLVRILTGLVATRHKPDPLIGNLFLFFFFFFL